MFQLSFAGIWSRIVLRRDLIELGTVGFDTVPVLARTLKYGYASIRCMLMAVFGQLGPEYADDFWLDGLRIVGRRMINADYRRFEGELLDMTLKLSRNHLLSISVSRPMASNAKNQPLPIPNKWLRNIIQHFAQWRDVHLTVRKADIPTTLNLLILNLPLLESLGVEICYTSDDWNSYIRNFGSFHSQPRHLGASRGINVQTIQIPSTVAPVLRRGARILDSESLRNASLPSPLPRYVSVSRNLTSLQIDTGALSAFYNALNEATRSPGHYTPTPTLLPRPRHLCLTTPEPPTGLGASDSGYRDHAIHEVTFRSITIENQALRSLEFRIPHRRARIAGRSICRVLNSLSQTGVELRKIRFRAAEGQCLSMVDWEAMFGSNSGAAVRGLELLDIGVGVVITDPYSSYGNDLKDVSERLLEDEPWMSGKGENATDEDHQYMVPTSGYN
ncbi:hypothetical protein PM082_022113 [Marasmius tenuissimus]|nr:hypothetical protein PM082_022113 [Marasmius tenuissimus]